MRRFKIKYVPLGAISLQPTPKTSVSTFIPILRTDPQYPNSPTEPTLT